MIVIACLISGMIGFSACSIFSGRAYDKGYGDGYAYHEELCRRVRGE